MLQENYLITKITFLRGAAQQPVVTIPNWVKQCYCVAVPLIADYVKQGMT